MLLLHAGFADTRLLLWGESAAPASTPKAARSNHAADKPGFYPYDAGDEPLYAALAECEVAFAPRPSPGWHLWAPTAAGMPLPSSPLVAEAPPGPLTLHPWRVTVIPLEPQSAVEFLGAIVGKEVVVPGLVVGSTLTFWAQAMRFAGALVATEQFLPGLVDGRAVWRPVIAGANQQRVATLAKSMPPGCQALSMDADACPTQSASKLLAAFLDETVDALVRATLPRAEARRMPVADESDESQAPRTPKRRSTGPKFASAHDQWLAGLRSATGELTGTAPDSDGLAEQVEQWQRPVTVAASAPCRLCFRLEEPPEEETNGRAANRRPGWYLRYLLQATSDPSLLMPVADAWSPGKRGGAAFRKRSFDVREYLYGALGQAATMCPPIVDSLKTATPGGQPLDASAAHGFLNARPLKSWISSPATSSRRIRMITAKAPICMNVYTNRYTRIAVTPRGVPATTPMRM